ncbi:hypothetical protein [Phaeodactylibacter xiamenensis]|jgi:hypothetical protein|uniref:hypothetical protein n=2 Tax=Phaeodactylibacter xiamenensis TaxID=1524460 RepID=UPI003BAACC8A
MDGVGKVGWITFEMMSSKHGNSHSNENDHHLYAIQDRKRKGIYKYGVCGRPLNKDGSSPRANEQVRLYNRVVGWARFFSQIILTGIKGRRAAEEKEAQYIEDYRAQYGENPPGNQ